MKGLGTAEQERLEELQRFWSVTCVVDVFYTFSLQLRLNATKC